jgi:hypothetical protein
MGLSGPQGAAFWVLMDVFSFLITGYVKKWRRVQGAGLKV